MLRIPSAAASADAMGRTDGRDFRRWLAAQLSAADDPRAARWWQLVAVIAPRHDQDTQDTHDTRQLAVAVQWLIAVLDAGAETDEG